jgi:hypothetical protein
MDRCLTLKIDKDTGLPELPEGHFWRVLVRYGAHYRIQIREEVKILGFKLGSTEVAEQVMLELTPNETSRRARELYQKTYMGKDKLALLGDYPPKSLNHAR